MDLGMKETEICERDRFRTNDVIAKGVHAHEAVFTECKQGG